MEYVVLVDENNNVLGQHPKDDVHSKNTPLHRGFSLFLFNQKHQLLLTQRAYAKKTFPGVWTNSVCGHPALNETPVESAVRRLNEELGISGADVKEVARYRYRFADKNGIVENEICPILICSFNRDPKPKPAEVEHWKWIDWQEFLREIKIHPDMYSPWCIEEAAILQQRGLVPQ